MVIVKDILATPVGFFLFFWSFQKGIVEALTPFETSQRAGGKFFGTLDLQHGDPVKVEQWIDLVRGLFVEAIYQALAVGVHQSLIVLRKLLVQRFHLAQQPHLNPPWAETRGTFLVFFQKQRASE